LKKYTNHEFKGNTKTVKTFACSRVIKCTPKQAERAIKAIGNQQIKSVKTKRAMRFAILKKHTKD